MDGGKNFVRDGESALPYADILARANNQPVAVDGEFFNFLAETLSALACGADVNLSVLKNGSCRAVRTTEGQTQRFKNVEEMACALMRSKSFISLETSGSTGVPKKIRHAAQNIMRGVIKAERHARDAWALCYPPAHMAGLQVTLQAFANGNCMISLLGKSPAEIFGLVENFKITHISATPTFYRLLSFGALKCGAVKRVTLGGEKSDAALYEKLKSVFPNAKIRNIYASTEGATLLVSEGEYFSIGENLADRIKIKDGELFVHKDLLGSSSRLALDGDFYGTSDMVEYERGGKRFRFVSRKNGILNVGGYKVDMEEIEGALKKMPQISNALVYGKKNSVLGNILCADIVSAEKIEVATVRKFLSAQVPQHMIPRIIRFVEALDMTASGKIKRL